MKRSATWLVAATCLLPCASYALTGNDIYDWGVQFEREGSPTTTSSFGYIGYISGASDAMNNILFCTPKNVTYLQAGSIVMKYLRNNPESRNELASALVLKAMAKAYPCKT